MNDTEMRLLDCAAVPMFVLEPDEGGRPIYTAFNRCACERSGLSTGDVIGKTATDVYPGRFGIGAFEHHVETINAGQARTYELSLPLHGSVRRVRTTLTPLLDDDGRLECLVGTSADITTENLIEETRANAETITSEMEQFVSIAAHDLRSPMRNIQYLADVIREDFQDLGDGKLDLLDKLEDVAAKTMALIAEVLANSQTTNLTDNKTLFDFGDLCADIIATLDPMAQHLVTYDAGAIDGDRAATSIVLRNLIDNAIKHGGREQLTLGITLADQGDSMFRITIRDNGKGFDDPQTAFQEKRRAQHDSGFGLMSIRRLVLARGGKVFASDADEGSGAVVTFTLPGRATVSEAG